MKRIYILLGLLALVVLAADTGLPQLTVLITPVDFRKDKLGPPQVKLPEWGDALYADLKIHLAELPLADLP